jgi:hypothetical protein
MYRRPKFLEILLEIRQEMAREADYDADLFTEMLRAGSFPNDKIVYQLTDEQSFKEKKLKNTKLKTPEHE